MESITMYFREGPSDKVYQAGIEPADGGYVVRFAYGRRGTTLQTGTKTSTPITHDEARRIYDKLVAEKTAKGYTPGESGTPTTPARDKTASANSPPPHRSRTPHSPSRPRSRPAWSTSRRKGRPCTPRDTSLSKAS